MTLSRQHLPLIATIAAFFALLTAASLRYEGFFTPTIFVNLVDDNAFVGIAAIGATFVILSGGIDLSVGAVIAFASIAIAVLTESHQVDPRLAIAAVLAAGLLFGAAMGALIHLFEMPAFLVTLAGMFLARGAAFMISQESVQLSHPFFQHASGVRIPLTQSVSLPLSALTFLAVVAVAYVLATHTRLGRNIYAIGGSEQSARLMGIAVGRSKISVYAIGGFCSALAGVVYTLYTSSGNATAGAGLELDAIAAAVIGGTLLTGGVGYVIGTLFGVLILGIIQTAITFENTVSSWWTRIAVGALIFCFIVIQALINRRRE
ncbi:MAG TPA: galactofuranose ABC transporter, permease protein YjfF [Bdellovibrionales bacterium]|nr:galactofuranose ABC transporter, permease protein YjfF [Bdellovibrionales bacterium]